MAKYLLDDRGTHTAQVQECQEQLRWVKKDCDSILPPVMKKKKKVTKSDGHWSWHIEKGGVYMGLLADIHFPSFIHLC